MTAKTRERLARIGVRDIYGEEDDQASDEDEGANLEEDNLQLLGQDSRKKQMTKEEMLYFKEKKKNQYLNTLLKNLNISLKKLDKEYGDEKMEKMTKVLAKKKQTQVQEREKKISSEIMNSMNQIKSLEQQTKTADKELAGLRKKYEKMMNKTFLRQLETIDQKQSEQIEKLKKENAAIETEQKQVDRQLAKQAKEEVRPIPYQEIELRNLRNKHSYLKKKFETEREKLLKLSQQKKQVKLQEAHLKEKETDLIENAKDNHDIDFQDAQQIAERGKQEAYREQHD